MPVSQPSGAPSIVAFDFDGTLTVRDSFAAFLQWYAGPRRWVPGLVQLVPALAAYALQPDRGRLKAAFARQFLAGLTVDAIAAQAEAFAAQAWADFMRPDALECWAAWKAKGATMVIVSASPEPLLAPFARRLGADALIGTRLAVDAAGRITGALEGDNCRGPEKVRRLQSRFGAGLTLAAAYGDTGGDREMLQIAAIKGYRVFTGRPC